MKKILNFILIFAIVVILFNFLGSFLFTKNNENIKNNNDSYFLEGKDTKEYNFHKKNKKKYDDHFLKVLSLNKKRKRKEGLCFLDVIKIIFKSVPLIIFLIFIIMVILMIIFYTGVNESFNKKIMSFFCDKKKSKFQKNNEAIEDKKTKSIEDKANNLFLESITERIKNDKRIKQKDDSRRSLMTGFGFFKKIGN